jgi:hypothetical protein
MSYQAQTAVTHHSKQTNVKRLRLLMYLAECASASGLIDPAPNQETLAEFIGCSTRTIRTMLNDLEADNELKQTRVGSGPGNPSAYQITLPLNEELTPKAENCGNSDDKGGRKAEENTDIFSTFAAFKAEVKAEISALKAEINQLKVENLEPKGGKAEAERRKGHSFKNADDPSTIHFDPNKKHIYAHPREEPIEEMMSVIAGVVKTPLGPGINEDEFESAAYTLIGWEVDPVDVFGFLEWWDAYGYYQGKPALKSFLSEYQNFKAGVRPENKSRASPAPAVPVLVEIEEGSGLY